MYSFFIFNEIKKNETIILKKSFWAFFVVGGSCPRLVSTQIESRIKTNLFFYPFGCDQNEYSHSMLWGFKQKPRARRGQKERKQARVWELRVKMGVTKEKVESTLTSKLNPSHLVSSSFTIFVLLFELCIFYFYASSHSHHPHIGLLICQFRVGK